MEKESDILLNIADVYPVSYSNGPGRRTVIWVQGCTLKCPGCFNQEFQPHIERFLVDPRNFAYNIIDLCKTHQCEGITLTGGEPFQQSPSVLQFAEVIKKEGLTIVCFSGYTFTELLKSKDENIQALLANIDLLIAGPFDNSKKYNRTWCDDPDKEIIYLNNQISFKAHAKSNDLEFIVDGCEISVTGFPEQVDYHILEELLNSKQIVIK